MIDTNKIQEAYANKKRKTADKIASFENKNSHNEKLIGSDRVQRAIVETTRLNIEHRDGHEPRVTVKNFPKKISTPDFKKIVAELKNLEKSLAPKNIDFSLLIEAVNSLKEQVAKIPTEHPEQPEPIEEVTVKNLETLKPSINKLEDAIKKLKLDPKINVESPTIPELDLTPVANIMSQIKESVLSIKIPDNSKSLSEVVKAQKAVKNAIDNLTFPVPNYVLPFKNTAGAATQVQLDSNGNVPIVGSITVDTTGLATSAKQDAQTALLTTIDADTGAIATEVAGLLTDTELRATPVPVSGTVTATPSGTQNVDVTANTIGLATSANQLPDGHNVTVDNAIGASAVPIQDGGNSITVDGTVAATQSGTWTEANSAAIKTAVETIDNAISGSEMQVDVVGALPAGTNAIGKLAANSGVDIGDVDVTSAVSSTFDHGSNRDIDTSAEQITSTSFACKFGVTVKADITNTGIVYIGNSDVTAGTTAATDGFPLSAGESLTLEVNNPNLLYAIGSANNQIVYWTAV